MGVYVRIHGKISDFDNKKRVTAWQIRPVTDFNEARAAAEPLPAAPMHGLLLVLFRSAMVVQSLAHAHIPCNNEAEDTGRAS